jgi:hypothetical protein
VPFAKLIKDIVKSKDEFMEVVLRVLEGCIFSYEKFVSSMGGAPTHVFSIFGASLAPNLAS